MRHLTDRVWVWGIGGVLVAAGCFALASACGAGGGDDDDDDDDDGETNSSDDDGVVVTSGGEKPGPSQGLSEECDADLGVDACGAGLFCAAFDGRTVTTCYAERSRMEDQECGENFHCVTNYCDDDVCSTKPAGAACEESIECTSHNCTSQGVCYGSGSTGFATTAGGFN